MGLSVWWFVLRTAIIASSILSTARGESTDEDPPAASVSAVPKLFSSRQTVSSRFAYLYKAGQNAPPLNLAVAALPHGINVTLESHALEWNNLGGTLQRLLLWDAGYVPTGQGKLSRIYVECGLSMDDTVVSREAFQAYGCPARLCDRTLTAAGTCTTNGTMEFAKCATDVQGDNAPATMLWSEEEPNLDIPRPTVFRISDGAFAIHMQETCISVASESCPSQIRVVIPCAGFDRGDSRWCIPKPTGILPSLLQNLRSSSTGRSEGNTAYLVMPLVLMSAMFLAAVAGFAYVVSRQKVKAMQQALCQTMNSKPLVEPSTTTTASDGVGLNFTYVHPTEMALGVPNDRLGRSFSGISNISGSSASSSFSDLINASEVLLAFQNDSNVLQKRIPFMDIVILRRLCNGASGEVFLGRVNGQRVAIKQLLRLKQNDLDDLENFAREIQLTATLDHPNIVQMLGVAWNTFQNMALVLEYRSGGDLLNAIRKRGARWSWNAEKLRIALGVARGIVYLHGRTHPLVHRDIKSRNILIDAATMEPALCDFGSSRNVSTMDLLSTDPAGTILWSAPEVICSQEYSARADIYSFGVVLAELDTCELPYNDERDSDGRTIQAIRIAHMVVEDQLKPQLSDHCPRFIRELVMKCVEHKPDRRPTAGEVLEKLSEAADDCAALWSSV